MQKIYAFVLPAEILKRYNNLVLNEHLSKNYMAEHMRSAFVAILNQAEAESGLKKTNIIFNRSVGKGKIQAKTISTDDMTIHLKERLNRSFESKCAVEIGMDGTNTTEQS